MIKFYNQFKDPAPWALIGVGALISLFDVSFRSAVGHHPAPVDWTGLVGGVVSAVVYALKRAAESRGDRR